MYDSQVKTIDGLPSLEMDYYNLPDCPLVWELLKSGDTKGVFQLEGSLGQKWSKELEPWNLEEISALISLMRPGCISGNTSITIKNRGPKNGRNTDYVKIRLKDLYEKYNNGKSFHDRSLVSFDEESYELFNNKHTDVFYSGYKDVYRPILGIGYRHTENFKFYDLECTADHELYVHEKGWTPLEDIEIGDRIAVVNNLKPGKISTKHIKGKSNFRDICFNTYKYECLFCDWQAGSLDVHHLEGNRHTNNDPDNLCFLCPNHHREYGDCEPSVFKRYMEMKRLPSSDCICWAVFKGTKYIGKKDVYDISALDPHHNS